MTHSFSIDLCHSNNDSFNKINIKSCFEWFLANDMNSKADSSLYFKSKHAKAWYDISNIID